MKEFNLLTEPWILALDEEGRTKPLSLMEIFAQAHRLKGLAGEMAAQDVALIRLFLAILYAVFGWEDLQGNRYVPQDADEARARWHQLWSLGQFPMEPISRYLTTWQERFYLFHPQTPFFQVAIDPQTKILIEGKYMPIDPLARNPRGFVGDVAAGAHKDNLFSHRAELDSIGCAEAARWLVHINSYDVSPLGAPPKGAFRAKGFKTPWPNGLGLVWAQGDSLFETLMLNFVLAPPGRDSWPGFYPSWEANDLPFDVQRLLDIQAALPSDPAALFSFPYRYLQLQRNESGRINGCVIWGGTLVGTESGDVLTETMTLWRKNKEGRLIPKAHDPAQQMWQNFGPLFSGAQAQPPGVVQWLSGLVHHKMLARGFLRLCICAVVLSGKSTSVDDAFSDSLRFHTSLLMNLADGWPARISSELDLTGQLVAQLGYLARDLVKASGGSGEKEPGEAAAKARTDGYFQLNTPFREWLESIDDTTDMEEACRAWRDTQRRLFIIMGQDLVRRSGLKALVGRTVTVGEKKVSYTSPELFQKYRGAIRSILAQ